MIEKVNRVFFFFFVNRGIFLLLRLDLQPHPSCSAKNYVLVLHSERTLRCTYIFFTKISCYDILVAQLFMSLVSMNGLHLTALLCASAQYLAARSVFHSVQ